jgi:adenylate cyclase
VGYATLGSIGFDQRRDYGAVGSVVNMASRLCDEAEAGQILVSQRVCSQVESIVETVALDAMSLKGFSRPVQAYSVGALKPSGVSPSA